MRIGIAKTTCGIYSSVQIRHPHEVLIGEVDLMQPLVEERLGGCTLKEIAIRVWYPGVSSPSEAEVGTISEPAYSDRQDDVLRLIERADDGDDAIGSRSYSARDVLRCIPRCDPESVQISGKVDLQSPVR